jgi:hypothetical protein
VKKYTGYLEAYVSDILHAHSTGMSNIAIAKALVLHGIQTPFGGKISSVSAMVGIIIERDKEARTQEELQKNTKMQLEKERLSRERLVLARRPRLTKLQVWTPERQEREFQAEYEGWAT